MSTPVSSDRCTLFGYMNNYVHCLDRMDDAMSLSAASDPLTDEEIKALKEGTRRYFSVTSPRFRAFAIVEDGLTALETWVVPSLEEGRRIGTLSALAPVLRSAHKSIAAVKDIVWGSAANHDQAGEGYSGARASAIATFQELETMASFVLHAKSRPALPSETLAASHQHSTLALPRSAMKAWLTYERAISAEPSLAEAGDQDVFDWIIENEQGSEYRKSDFQTFTRYLRKARRSLGKSKYSSRAGRTGRSIISPGG